MTGLKNETHGRRALAVLRATALSLPLAFAGACGGDVPEEPTWAEDVRPILMANCASCHSFPPVQGAESVPELFRLDVFGGTTLDEGTEFRGEDVGGEIVLGAGDVSDRIVARAVEQGTMPPALPGNDLTDFRPLSSRQKEILQRWHDQGAERGPPAPGNRPPEMELLRPLSESQDGDTIVIEYEIRDPDFDYVTGELGARSPGGSEVDVITYGLHSGRGEAIWDVSGRSGENLELVATLDDGSESVEIDLGAVDIE